MRASFDHRTSLFLLVIVAISTCILRMSGRKHSHKSIVDVTDCVHIPLLCVSAPEITWGGGLVRPTMGEGDRSRSRSRGNPGNNGGLPAAAVDPNGNNNAVLAVGGNGGEGRAAGHPAPLQPAAVMDRGGQRGQGEPEVEPVPGAAAANVGPGPVAPSVFPHVPVP